MTESCIIGGGMGDQKKLFSTPSKLCSIVSVFVFFVQSQGTLLLHASFDPGVNEYIIGQRWQCV